MRKAPASQLPQPPGELRVEDDDYLPRGELVVEDGLTWAQVGMDFTEGPAA